jgi:hypothetical protein
MNHRKWWWLVVCLAFAAGCSNSTQRGKSLAVSHPRARDSHPLATVPSGVTSTDGGRSVDASVDVAAVGDATMTMGENLVARENSLPGTDAWKLTNAATNHQIEGYASTVSASPGDGVSLFVSVSEAHDARWELYRLGYYGGLGGRLVTSGAFDRLSPQQPCPVTEDTGLIECTWNPSLEFVFDLASVSGYYVFKLIRDDGFDSYVPVVLREYAPRAPLLVQASVTTWQAYNQWGGASLYVNNLPPDDHFTGAHAYQVSFDRPYLNPSGNSAGSGDLLVYEVFMLQWLESKGYDLAYTTNIDVDADPSSVLNRKLFLDVGHDEYWTLGERDALEHARDSGVDLGFFSGNSGYWRIRLNSSSSSIGRRVITCYKDHELDPMGDGGAATVRFRDPPLNRPENELIGQMYEIFTRMDGFPMVVTNPDHWLYAGTNVKAGDAISHIVGDEWDHVWVHHNTPAGLEVVAHSDAFGVFGSDVPSDVTVYYPTPSSFVFSAGTRQWTWAFSKRGYVDSRIARVTENVMARAGLVTSSPTVVETPPAPSDVATARNVSVIAGKGSPGYRDGDDDDAMFNEPVGVAVDSKGTIYVTDSRNHRVRAIADDGTVTTFAGSGRHNVTMSYIFADGRGTKAAFDVPTGIAIGPDDVIYVSDTENERIRMIKDGVVSTFAGSGAQGNTDATDPLKASFNYPRGLAVAPDGALYVADAYNEAIRRIGPEGVSTVATAGGEVTAVAVDADGTLYVLSSSGSISTVTNGVLTPFIDVDGLAGDTGGPGATARLRPADGLVVDGRALIVSDSANYKVRRVELTGDRTVTTLVGDGRAGLDVGSGAATHVVNPRGIAVTPSGYVVADCGNHRILRIDR